MKGWTQKDIDRLQNKKQVKTKRSSPKSKQLKGRLVTKYFPQKSKEKDFIEYHLVEFYKTKGVRLYEEYRFHEVRRWRLDWCFPDIKLAIEYEGIFSAKSRHTSIKGFTGDCDKYNSAQLQGFTVLRYTAMNYRNIIEDINTYHGQAQNRHNR